MVLTRPATAAEAVKVAAKRIKSADKRNQEAQVRSQFAQSDKAEWVSQVQEAPTYRPTADELEDPIKFIQSIQAEAAQYGQFRFASRLLWF